MGKIFSYPCKRWQKKSKPYKVARNLLMNVTYEYEMHFHRPEADPENILNGRISFASLLGVSYEITPPEKHFHATWTLYTWVYQAKFHFWLAMMDWFLVKSSCKLALASNSFHPSTIGVRCLIWYLITCTALDCLSQGVINSKRKSHRISKWIRH